MSRVHSRFVSVLLCLLASIIPVTAWTQDDISTRSNDKSAELTERLRGVSYDPVRSGPLFAVALPTDHATEETNSLRGIMEAFQRKIVKVGSLNVLAPREMTLIVVPTRQQGTAADYSPGDAFVLLLDSLTDAQFDRIVGAGLTATDLTREQIPYWDALWPKPMKAALVRYYQEEGVRTVTPITSWSDTKSFSMRDLRLRLTSKPQILMGDPTTEAQTVADQGDLREETLWYKAFDSFDKDDVLPQTSFGKTLYPRVSSRLKPSELDYDASVLNVPVLIPVSGKTLGDTLAQVAQATGLELYADQRVAVLPAVWRANADQSARAGDILEALAWSITGAFRRLGARTFLLTDDIEGIGTRLERVDRWVSEAGQAQNERVFSARERVRKRGLLGRLTIPAEDRLHLPQEQETRIQAMVANGAGTFEIPPVALPKALRERLDLAAEDFAKRNPAGIDRRKLRVRLSPELTLFAPDGKRFGMDSGEFAGVTNTLSDMLPNNIKTVAPPSEETQPPVPPIQIDPKVKRRVLVARISDEKDAPFVVAEAKKRGFTELWVAVSLAKTSPTDLTPLSTAVVAGVKNKIPVGAVVSLLKDEEIADLERDVNIVGESVANDYTGTWIAPTETAMTELARRTARIAAVPGLAGLAVRNAFARGYTTDANLYDISFQRGYVIPFRLAFVREQSIDPVDMPMNPSRKSPLPLFPESGLEGVETFVNGRAVRDAAHPGAFYAWRQFREKQSIGALATTIAAIRKAAPKLPLYQSERLADQGEVWPGFFADWTMPERIIRRPRFSEAETDVKAVYAVSPTALVSVRGDFVPINNVFTGTRNEKLYVKAFTDNLFDAVKQSTDGFVFDVSPLSTKDALKLLTECFASVP